MCNFKLRVAHAKLPEEQAIHDIQQSANSPSATLKLGLQEAIDLDGYLEDCHNYYIKPCKSDGTSNEFEVVKEPLSQTFVEPHLKMNPSDTVLFQRNGKQVLSIKRICQQLPAYIIVASFQAAMRLLDVFSQIPFESIFVEEALEMTPQQYNYLDCCYNITSKYRFLPGVKSSLSLLQSPLPK